MVSFLMILPFLLPTNLPDPIIKNQTYKVILFKISKFL